ncbi:MAG: TIGR00266 family protein [Oscillospiraceae bacterium]|nr:TIGR00266 family protein [Oscillospiraceae bacterium]
MEYQIKGTPFPALVCKLNAGESIDCQKGAMSWMSPNMNMQTSAGGGIGKLFTRALSGESIFKNKYTAQGGPGEIAFASTVPGNIIPVQINASNQIVAQKRAYLASTEGVEMEMFFQKKIGAGIFGGEGFIMQKFCGEGIVFVEVDGSVLEYNLDAGESMILDTGYLAMMDATCSIDIQSTGGVGNALFGGEGLFNTRVTGPGRIWIQTLPVYALAGAIQPYIVTSN